MKNTVKNILKIMLAVLLTAIILPSAARTVAADDVPAE